MLPGTRPVYQMLTIHPDQWIGALQYLIDGRLLAAAFELPPGMRRRGSDLPTRTIDVWDVDRQEVVCQIPIHSQVIDCTFNKEGTLVGFVETDQITVFDLAQKKPLWKQSTSLESQSVEFSPPGNLIALSGCFPNTFTDVREVATGEKLLSLKRDWYCISAAFSPDEKQIALVGGDEEFSGGPLLVLDLQGNPRWEVGGSDPLDFYAVNDLAFSWDGKLVATVESNIRLWHTDSGKLYREYKGDLNTGQFRSIHFHTDGNSFLATAMPAALLHGGSYSLNLRWLNFINDRDIKVFSKEDYGRSIVEKGPDAIALSKDGRKCASVFLTDSILVWNLD